MSEALAIFLKFFKKNITKSLHRQQGAVWWRPRPANSYPELLTAESALTQLRATLYNPRGVPIEGVGPQSLLGREKKTEAQVGGTQSLLRQTARADSRGSRLPRTWFPRLGQAVRRLDAWKTRRERTKKSLPACEVAMGADSPVRKAGAKERVPGKEHRALCTAGANQERGERAPKKLSLKTHTENRSEKGSLKQATRNRE